MKTFDLKIGMLCNNECVHCVVANRRELRSKTPDMKYGEIIRFLKTVKLETYESIVITGGEPTLFKFLGRLVKYIHTTYPRVQINIQTNGRLLKNFVDDFNELYNDGVNLNFIIAIHADTYELHDKITDSKNSFNQTLESIKLFTDLFGDKFIWRSETVLSKFNLHRIIHIVNYLIDIGAKDIGLSYPHLDGYVNNPSCDLGVGDIGFDYDDLLPYIPELTNIMASHIDIHFSLEEFPPCLWYNQTPRITLPMNGNVHYTTLTDKTGYSLSYMGTENSSDNDAYLSTRRHYPSCVDCIWYSSCTGIWEESFNTFKNKCLIPVVD